MHVVQMQKLNNIGAPTMTSAQRAQAKKSKFSQELIYDSIKVDFSPEIFIWEFFLHITFPWLLPFCKNIHAHRFSSLDPLMLWSQWILPIIVQLMCLSYILSTDAVKGELFVPLLFFIIHRTMVALKYASLSEGEYHRIITCTFEELIEEYQNQLQLVTGWLAVFPPFVEYEVDSSCRRMDVDLKNNKIIMADPSKSDENKEQLCAWHEFLKHDAYIERKERIKRKAQKKKEREAFAAGKSLNSAENPSLHAELSSNNDEGDQMVISALDVCKSIIYYATNLKYHRWYSMQLVRFIAVVHASTAFMTSRDSNSDWTIWTSIFVATSFIVDVAFFNQVVWFFYVTIFDMARQYRIARILQKMIRTTHLELQTTVRLGNISGSAAANAQKAAVQLEELVKQSNKAFLNRLSIFRENDKPARPASVQVTTNPMTAKATEKKIYDFSDQTKERVAEIIPVPRLSLDSADNVYSWLYIRLVLQDFGYRVRFRLNVYIYVVLFVSFGLMLVAISRLYNAFIDSDNSELGRVMRGQPFIQTLITISIFFLLTIILAYFASLVNEQFMKHRGDMMSYVVKNRAKLYATKKSHEVHEDLQDAVDALEVTISAIEIKNELSPYRILGVAADFSLMSSLGAILFVFYMIVFNIATGNVDNLFQI